MTERQRKTQRQTDKRTELVAIRLSLEEVARLNRWRRRQEDPPTKSEAIRLLALQALDDAEKS